MDNPQAFPSPRSGEIGQKWTPEQPGMTIRDYFAGQVIVGHVNDGNPNKLASYAYEIADAMIAERSKNNDQS